MSKTTKLFLALLVTSNFVVFSQEISSGATTVTETFGTSTGANATQLNLADDWTTTGNSSEVYKWNQTIINNNANNDYSRITIKARYRWHQWETPIKGVAGDIITLKMKFRTNANHTGYLTGEDGDLFTFGLKSVLDSSDTTAPISGTAPGWETRNGETTVINIANADGAGPKMLNVRYKNYDNANAAFDTNVWKDVTMKYFIGTTMAKSKIFVKLDNDTASSGWLNYPWKSQLLYDAITNTADPTIGAFMICGSGASLGSSGAADHLWIDSYDFTTTNDTGQVFISGGYAADDSWNTGSAPTSNDRVFIMNTNPNLNNASGNFDADYMYVSPGSKLTLTKVGSFVVPTVDIDGQINVVGANFNEGTIKIGTGVNNSYNSKITLDDTADLLNVANAGYLLNQSTYYLRYKDGGPKWTTYNGTNWNTVDTSFPSAGTDYSSKNLFLATNNTEDDALDGTFTFKNISIIVGKKLRINANAKITVTNLNNYGEPIDAFNNSSLIVNGTATGDLKYWKYLGTTNWYLMSSPVVGEIYNDAYVTANGIDSGAGSNRGIATYATSINSWTYMQIGAADATFNSGTGYGIKRSASGNITFEGTIKTDAKSVSLVTSGQRFRLIGNPYSSSISSKDILERSSSALDTETIWIWDQSANSGAGDYLTKVAGVDFKIAPSQGFFVQADTDGGDVLMESTDRVHASGTFRRTVVRPEIYLNLSDGSTSRKAEIYYIEGTTTGFDNGYDGPMFGGVANEFAIYSHSVSNGSGRDLAVQSLPTNNYENMVIPVGINAESGTITIDASTNNFPEGVNIYLEDKEDDTFTLLNANTNFSTTIEDSLSGIGRFYLHTTSESLSADDLKLDISIYNSISNNLRIVGVQNGTANLQLYNLLGKEVLKTSFEGSGINYVKLNNMPIGIYIVKLTTENSTLNKKIIIQ